ncbi:MAG: hypothetical protein JSS66_09820 [Armatimonadetes bacterium]|nr:hypothetical protein [Armatimonadota bacterium]
MLTALLLIATAQDDPIAAVFTKKSVTCRSLAEAANAYIAMGEEKAAADLVRRGDGGQKLDYMPRFSSVRACHLCRILFVGKGGPLRPPKLGVIRLPRFTMPLSKWPEFPMVQQNDVWFELGNAYLLSGKGESAAQYVDTCRKTGTFRKDPVEIPTEEGARLALKDLIASDRWGAIVWSDSRGGENYDFPPSSETAFLANQTHFY